LPVFIVFPAANARRAAQTGDFMLLKKTIFADRRKDGGRPC
jgi:hypothetical protein